ncbi:hypothetical protein V5799_003819 [Amblyomma americanum]|uniref:Uncharacterized protein n=1 Tax=Amblyomma americanum TaxID=6943 RepID=A0AAQ4D7V9_AMBAM
MTLKGLRRRSEPIGLLRCAAAVAASVGDAFTRGEGLYDRLSAAARCLIQLGERVTNHGLLNCREGFTQHPDLQAVFSRREMSGQCPKAVVLNMLTAENF